MSKIKVLSFKPHAMPKSTRKNVCIRDLKSLSGLYIPLLLRSKILQKKSCRSLVLFLLITFYSI